MQIRERFKYRSFIWIVKVNKRYLRSQESPLHLSTRVSTYRAGLASLKVWKQWHLKVIALNEMWIVGRAFQAYSKIKFY